MNNIKTFMTVEDDKIELLQTETIFMQCNSSWYDGTVTVEGLRKGDSYDSKFTRKEVNDFKANLNRYKFVLHYNFWDYDTILHPYIEDGKLVFKGWTYEICQYTYGSILRWVTWVEDTFETDDLEAEVTFYEDGSILVDIPFDNPCLIEGTPINMADGTEKPIEEVKRGDIVLSYDPNTETQVPAVVLNAYPTGADRLYNVYNFSNGKHLTIFGLHGYYDKVSGTTWDIRNINRDKRLLDINGETIQWAGTRERHFAGQKKVRYNIITSNNLYYANGILLGSRPYNKLQYHLDRGIVLPENIKSVWQQDCNDYNTYEDLLTDGAFWSEVAEDYQELAKARNIIRVNKKRLENTDYQNAKQVEGLLTEEEWAKSMDRRAFFRKEINDNESVYRTHQDNVDKVIARYRGDMTAKSIFDACCARDNAIFTEVKNYFTKK